MESQSFPYEKNKNKGFTGALTDISIDASVTPVLCLSDANGVTSEDVYGGEEDEEKDEEGTMETQDLMLEEEEAHFHSASKTHADLASGEVDSCYQKWLESAVAAKVKAFLEAEL